MAQPPLRVHVRRAPESRTAQTRLRAALAPNVVLSWGDTLPEPADFHVLVSGRVDAAWRDASPHLHSVVIPWAGLPGSTRETLLAHPEIAVHNLHYNAAPVAEYAFTLMLAAAKHIVPLHNALRQGDWRPRYEPGRALLLDGRTALVLGYGAIGRRVAALCQGIGMRVLATRRSATEVAHDGVAAIHPPGELVELLPQAAALHVTLPLTDETRGLIGERELSLLPAESVVVNVGRGAVIDEAALYAALANGGVHAAGIDVWYSYPDSVEARGDTLPSSLPFHELDNVVMSPHKSSSLHGNSAEQAWLNELANLLNALAAGEPAPNRVDVARGY